ncbi:amino acid permease [Methanoplanus sp. FWC-SCC4]|uniref:Amino acid permease n=1 Tax=Methanochimaera problematica TaxID=2609417 RepID=A0AA97FC32_9EURY|nr:amino acid permease [Methanoplanus sp. FWC-SCC4]WOF16720.1 amino acid permease [Methanoplanus sp. FWC-SCC4]
MDKREEQVPLMRVLGLPEVVISGVGVILGAGIYALIGEAAATSGNALWLSFLLSASIAAFTGLSYMELSSMFPEASAEYEYTRQSFGCTLAFITGTLVILSGIIGASTVALGFAGYFNGFTGADLYTVAIFLIISLAAVLFIGIKQSAYIAIIFTFIESAGLVGIIAIALPHIGSVNYLEMPQGISGVFIAASLIFFAYQGFEEIVKLSEETVSPEKNIPKGLLLALIFTIILYILVSISIVSIGGWEAVAGSPNPFAKIAGSVFPEGYLIFTFIALFATANTVLLMMLSASRIMYGMAKKGRLPQAVSYVSKSRRTPVVAIVIVTVLSILFLSAGGIKDVAFITNFTLFATFAIINASVIVLRIIMPDSKRPFKVPFSILKVPVIPLLGIMTCLFFLFQMDMSIILIGVGIIIISATINVLYQTSLKRKG